MAQNFEKITDFFAENPSQVFFTGVAATAEREGNALLIFSGNYEVFF
ncbi:hypothetical protein [Desulfobotulus sp.]|nr:hypothetical protein [Desulfobotulus sp.]MDY0162691.1 hypothetical protein [Desulfobotulus sp.]